MIERYFEMGHLHIVEDIAQFLADNHQDDKLVKVVISPEDKKDEPSNSTNTYRKRNTDRVIIKRNGKYTMQLQRRGRRNALLKVLDRPTRNFK